MYALVGNMRRKGSTLLNGIVAYYNFDEASGNLLDQVNSYNGTVTGATQNVTGKIGTAYSFDGVNDYVNIDSVLTPLATTTQGTWAFWVKPIDATPATNQFIIAFGDTNEDTHLSSLITTSGILSVASRILGATQWQLSTNSSVFSDNTWAHIVIVQNGISPVLYINGTEYSPGQSNATFTTSTDQTIWFSDITGLDNGRFACWNYSSLGNIRFLNGTIDEVGLWNRALTPDEVTELYNSETGKTHPFT